MFSKVNKPYGYFVGLSNEVVYDIFQDLPVSAIPFIGKGYQKRLGQHIQTVYDFSRESMFYYKRIIGKNATQLWFEINGVNCMTFAHTGVQKSISKTRSFNDEITNRSDLLWKRLVLNVDRLFEEMILNEFQLRNITLFLRNKAFETSRMSFEFEDYHCDRKQVVEVLAQMLKELQIS